MISQIDGVFAAGIHCGIKSNGRLDLGFIYVPGCVGSAVVLSQNAIRSATLDHNEHVFDAGSIQLIIVNSGNANSVTGQIGIEHIKQTVQKAAQVFDCDPSKIAVASTGIIGVPMPIQSLLSGLDQFLGHEKNGKDCADAILTTDLVPKSAHASVKIQGHEVQISGITKGSGMIAPNMATTLGFIVTDLSLSNEDCQRMLKQAIAHSYNMLSVDTDQSTNDMVTLQSSGVIDLALTSEDLAQFQLALTGLCIDLAKQIARDGEGANHLIEVNVNGALSVDDAKRVAKQVVESPLVKTAVAGEDPNWGRIVMAVGKDSSVSINLSLLSLQINKEPIFTLGEPEPFDRNALKALMASGEVKIDITIENGPHSATAWGCDLTHAYIDINTAYN